MPRIGELVSFEPYRCHQVLDVLWHLDDDPCVSITACELCWHKHMAETRAAGEPLTTPAARRATDSLQDNSIKLRDRELLVLFTAECPVSASVATVGQLIADLVSAATRR